MLILYHLWKVLALSSRSFEVVVFRRVERIWWVFEEEGEEEDCCTLVEEVNTSFFGIGD